MKKRKLLWQGLLLILLFISWTAAVRLFDIQAIGPRGSRVGFGEINGFVHGITGVNMGLYNITDWLGLIPFGFAAGFAVLGLYQWIKRKSIRNVDRSLIALGVFYAAVIAVYVLFEVLVVNYRPVLINGVLEVSYPSSTTVLVICVMTTTVMQLRGRIKNAFLRCCAVTAIDVFTAFMVIGRLVSGVHWLTDIVGGALVSIGLVFIYKYMSGK